MKGSVLRRKEYVPPKVGEDGKVVFNLKMWPEEHKFMFDASRSTNIPVTSMFLTGGKKQAILERKRHAEDAGEYSNR